MKKTVYFVEIFEQVGKASKKQDKINILLKYAGVKGFKELLFLCYEPTLKWVITREDIENLKYDHMDIADYDMAPTNLFLEAPRRLFNFTNWRQPELKQNKILRLISNMFSVMHHEEIELFKQVVNRKIKTHGLTENLVREAFPTLLTPKEGE